ncbi:hypothetical protein [Bremerella cremea]|nr:hypothetical protein [Bremerella cremea]
MISLRAGENAPTVTDFLRHVLPSNGHAVLAFRWRNRPREWSSKSYDLAMERDLILLQMQLDTLEKLAKSSRRNASQEFDLQVYFEIATQMQPVKSPRRGSGKTTASVACLALDIDCYPKKPAYPPRAAALRILEELLPPSIVVDSGSGIHAYWLLDEPILFASQNDRDAYRDLLSLWEDAVALKLSQAGYQMDVGQSRVSRLLRLPGTWNTGGHAPVLITGGTWESHNPQTFRDIASRNDITQTVQKSDEISLDTELHTMGIGLEGRVKLNSGFFETPALQHTPSEAVQNIHDVFDRYVPIGKGERHSCLKQIVCFLKSDEVFRTKPVDYFKSEFDGWYEKARDRITTRSYEANWKDFRELWRDIKYGYAGTNGKKPLSEHFRNCSGEGRELLRAVVISISADSEGEAFPLDGRSLAKFFPQSHRTIAYWLRDLVEEGLLEIVTPGLRGRAAEYRLLRHKYRWMSLPS